MIKIERECGAMRFIMTFSAPGTGWRSYKVKAKNTAEVKQALDHHFDGGAKDHLSNGKQRRNCPLCRRMKEKRGK